MTFSRHWKVVEDTGNARQESDVVTTVGISRSRGRWALEALTEVFPEEVYGCTNLKGALRIYEARRRNRKVTKVNLYFG